MNSEATLWQRYITLVIGDPIAHSMSPLLHNAAYEQLGLSAQRIFTAARVTKGELGHAIRGVRALGLAGLAVTLPHKELATKLVDELDPAVSKIGALNTIVNRNGHLVGYNTDYLGILRPLERATKLLKARVAVLGAGGAARAAIYALKIAGAEVHIFNRTLERAESLAQEFGANAGTLSPELSLQDFAVIINATSVGLAPNINYSPIVASSLHPGQIVFDTVYNPLDTLLLKHAQQRGCTCIQGLEMFLEQGAEQIRLFTGLKPEVENLRQILKKQLLAR